MHQLVNGAASDERGDTVNRDGPAADDHCCRRLRLGWRAARFRVHMGYRSQAAGGATWRSLAARRHESNAGNELCGMVTLHARGTRRSHGPGGYCATSGGNGRARLQRAPPAPPRRQGGGRAACREMAVGTRVVFQPIRHRSRSRPSGSRVVLHGYRVLGGGRSRKAGAGRVPAGGSQTRGSWSKVRGRGRLNERHHRCKIRGHAHRRDPESSVPPRPVCARIRGHRAPFPSRPDARDTEPPTAMSEPAR
jgi:hypothetical protein